MSGTTRITCADFDAAIGPEVGGTYDGERLFQVPPFQRVRDKVAIVGFTDHREEALKLGDDFELWGLNELYRYMPIERFHRWFEIHGREYLSVDGEGKKHIEDLKSALGALPIYMQKRHEDIPCSVRFPIGELIDHFGGADAIGADYFTNCPAEMLAFAIALGYGEIHMYGIDMAQDSEYATQRPCCEYWLGIARGKGVTVYVPRTSDLLKCVGTYGYEDAGSDLSRKIQSRLKFLHVMDNERLDNLRKLDAQYQQQVVVLGDRKQRAVGAAGEAGHQIKNKAKREARIAELQGEVKNIDEALVALEREYRDKHTQLFADRHRIYGGIQDCEYWQRAWSMKADSVGGGNIPTPEQRAADARTGIQSGDSRPALAAVK